MSLSATAPTPFDWSAWRPRVLLFTDHPIRRSCLGTLFAKTPCDAVDTLDEALQKIQHQSYDLIFMSDQRPMENSVHAIQRMQAHYQYPFDPPLIVLTIEDDPAVGATYREAGARLVIKEPLTVSMLQRLHACFFMHPPTSEQALSRTIFDYAASAYLMHCSIEEGEEMVATLQSELKKTLSNIGAAEIAQDVACYHHQLALTLEITCYVRLPELESLLRRALLALERHDNTPRAWEACARLQQAIQRILTVLSQRQRTLSSYPTGVSHFKNLG